MDIAILADIHGNYPALEAVLEDLSRWDPDLVFVLGDIINRGPRSKACLQLLRENAPAQQWKFIRGNHEDYVLDFDNPATPRSGLAYEILRSVHWTYSSLSTQEVAYLKSLPQESRTLLPDGKVLAAVHASMMGPRAGIYPETPDDQIANMIQPAPELLVVGHTHQPLIRRVNKTTIINAGSVGLPFDGDQRTGYARLQQKNGQWLSDIVRLPYNLERAEKDFQMSGFLEEGGPVAFLILGELRLARPQLSHWSRQYKNQVIAGKISLEDAVEEYLTSPNCSCPL